jgi:tetratricopeptide (TPR) repeat protein
MMENEFRIILEFKKVYDTTLNVRTQKAILDIIIKPQGRHQSTVIRGAVDSHLVETYQTKLTPKVFWNRQKHWELLDLATYKKRSADRFFALGDYKMAHGAYHYLVEFIYDAGRVIGEPVYDDVLDGDDDLLIESLSELRDTVNLSYARLCVLQANGTDNPQASRALYEIALFLSRESRTQHTDEIMWATVCGISAFCLDDYNHAYEYFQSATQHSAVTPSSRQLYQLMVDFEQSGRRKADVSSLRARMTEILQTDTGNKPQPFEPPSTLSEVDLVHVERDVLNKLHYTGDLLVDRIRQAPVVSVSPTQSREVARMIALCRKALAKAERLEKRNHVTTYVTIGHFRNKDAKYEFKAILGDSARRQAAILSGTKETFGLLSPTTLEEYGR